MTRVTITIKLHRDIEMNEWYLDKVEALNGNVKSVTSFTVPVPLRNAFAPDVFHFLIKQLPVRSDLAVCSIEDCSFPALDLVLKDIRIVAQRAFAGHQAVTIRSKGHTGDVIRLYAPELKVGDGLLEAPQRPREQIGYR